VAHALLRAVSRLGRGIDTSVDAARKSAYAAKMKIVAKALLPTLFVCASFAQSPAINAAFDKYWAADSPSSAARAASEIAKSGVSFDDAWKRLKAGRAYAPRNPGVVMLKNRTSDGVEHNYAVTVPANYDPARRYQVRFQLHGGVGGRTSNQPRGSGEIGALAGAEQFYVMPYSWDANPWWSDGQVLNLAAIVDALKRSYNIDENRVVIAGVSDGATGAYYIAMRDTTPYASFLPLNGFLLVLANEEIDDGRSFPNNLRNKPWFVINGGLDRLYPTSVVEPFTRHLMAGGVSIDYHPQPNGEHNTRWWPEMKDVFEKFAAGHPRDPHPARLTWQAADTAHNRAHWLVIDRFGAAPGQARELADLNDVPSSESLAYGSTGGKLFGRDKQAGRVDIERAGNTIQAATHGVMQFTLLLSPDAFDFSQPIRVLANGREVFHGRVERKLDTLLKCAARDNDRTMLYAAELTISSTR